MFELTHNYEEFGEALAVLAKKQIKSIFKQSMNRAIRKGRATSRRALGKRMKSTKGKTWTQFFNEKTRVFSAGGESVANEYTGLIIYSGKRAQLKDYTTVARLERHRRQANLHNFGRGRKAKPLQFDFIHGKKTTIKNTFAGRGKSGRLQVFRRSDSTGKLTSPTGPSIAQQLRSKRNIYIIVATKREMIKTYTKEFEDRIKFRFSQAVAKANKKALS